MEISVRWNITWLQCNLGLFFFYNKLLLLLIIISSINIIIIINNIMIMITISIIFGEFTQTDGRKKRTSKRSCVTNVTALLLSDYLRGFSWSSLNIFLKICLIESEVWQRVISNKVIVTLFTQGLPSSFLSRPILRKFIIIVRNDHHWRRFFSPFE